MANKDVIIPLADERWKYVVLQTGEGPKLRAYMGIPEHGSLHGSIRYQSDAQLEDEQIAAEVQKREGLEGRILGGGIIVPGHADRILWVKVHGARGTAAPVELVEGLLRQYADLILDYGINVGIEKFPLPPNPGF
ncbi:MAG TPA: hypothetical protein HA362_05155 [Nanoarchaeota archaeon]|nr:hypothetical protein [Nanoarchaeota archaeon]